MNESQLDLLKLDEAYIEKARQWVPDVARNTPLILESLSPVGSFKIRGAAAAIRAYEDDVRTRGLVTASTGNFAQGLVWAANHLLDEPVPCTVIVPDLAPAAKVDVVERMGARIVRVPVDDWFRIVQTHTYDHVKGVSGRFVHPCCDTAVLAGAASVGLEILEQLPDVTSILVPYGGGGLTTGIASALKSRTNSRGERVRVVLCERQGATPVSGAFKAGAPVDVDYSPSFVDGIGGRFVLNRIWPLVTSLIDSKDVAVVSERAIADAIRTIASRAHVIAEGAGAAPVAAALEGAGGGEGAKVVCVVSGGNIDMDKLVRILNGEYLD